jgi:DedD protein
MEVKGEKFLENIALEKEKARLKEQSEYLDSQKQKTFYNSTSNDNPFKDEKNSSNDFARLDDIVLDNGKSGKQKYIVFGFALVLLFLITIITIKLIQEPKAQNNFTNNSPLEDIDKDIPKITTKKINHSLDIDKIIQSEDTVKMANTQDLPEKQTPKDTSDIFGMEAKTPKIEEVKLDQKEQIDIKPKVKKEIKRKNIIDKKPIKEIIVAKKLEIKKVIPRVTKPIGYFIQVGAFTKAIDNKLINTLKNNNYPFILHKMTIKGRLYTKVLVGNYKTKKDAMADLSKVRKAIHNPSSYILRLK